MTTKTRDSRGVPAGARVANPRPKTAEKRQRILEAAMSIFATKGFNNGSLLEIGEQAGVTNAGIIHHFGSKDQLLVAMLEYRDHSDVAELEGKHIPDGEALFEHLIHTVRLNVERRGVVQLYAVLCADSVTEGHPAQEYFRQRFVGLREMVTGALRDIVPGVPEERLNLAASSIIATMDGLQVQWLLDPEAVDMPEAVGFAISAVIEQLRTSR